MTAQGARNRELENELRAVRGEPSVPPSYSSSSFDFVGTMGSGGSPLGDVQEEAEENVKREEQDEDGRRGRRRVRNPGAEGMDVDGE